MASSVRIGSRGTGAWRGPMSARPRRASVPRAAGARADRRPPPRSSPAPSTDEPPHFRQRAAGDSNPWKIGHVGAVSLCSSFDDDEVVHRDHLRPAVFRMLLSVPGGTSAEGWPATVSLPVFLGCLSWRWEPSTTTSRQPPSCSSRSRSRTFTGECLAKHARRVQPRLRLCKFAARDRGWIRSRKPGVYPMAAARALQKLPRWSRRAEAGTATPDPYFWAERMKAATSFFSCACADGRMYIMWPPS